MRVEAFRESLQLPPTGMQQPVMRRGWLTRLTVAGTAGGLMALAAGCGQPTPTYAEVQGLMNVSCTFSACHGTGRAGGLSLVAADSYCQLVGQKDGATYRTEAKDPYPRRVVAGNHTASFLHRKLTLTTAESGASKPLGDVMPQNQPLDQKSIDTFTRWIDGGAPDGNGTPAPANCP